MTKEQILRDLGLSDKEVKIYLALLSIGQSSVNSIAKRARLNRVTTYDVLKYLQEKGLVSYVIKSGVKYYEAAEPSKFLGDLQEKQAKVKSILPELEELKESVKEKPGIEVYEGLAGLKTILEDVIKENKESWFISDSVFMDSLEFYFPHLIKQKRKQGIFSRVITSDNKRMRQYKAKNPKKYVDLRFIDEKLHTTKIIYGDKVATLTFEKENSMGIMVRNKQMAENERKLFELLWKQAKK